MIRRMARGLACRNGIVAALAATVLAAAMLLPAAPAEAGWLGRGLGVAGVARSIKRNIGEAVDLLDDTLGAAFQGDFEEVERLSGELREVPGRIITDAFPVLSIGAAALKGADAAGKRLKAAGRRVGRFVGDRVADARMALEAGEYETEAGVLDRNRPLPAVTLSGPSGTSRPAPSGSSAANAPDPWGQAPEEDEETAAGGADPWGQDPKEEETAAGEVDPPGEDVGAGREGGDVATKRLQDEYSAALDRFLSAEKGGSDYEAALSALLEREKELLAKVVGPEEQELTPDERRRVQACLAEREFNPGTPDGIFGPRTRTAIRAWQATQGREQSGRLDQSSARTLLEECEVALAEADTETTTEPVERTFEPKCAAIFDGQPEEAKDELLGKTEICYLEFDDRPGCHLRLSNDTTSGDSYAPSRTIVAWLDEFSPSDLVNYELNWSGSCSGGMLDGRGTISFQRHHLWGNLSRKWTGQYVDGVAQGDWKYHRVWAFANSEGSTSDGEHFAEFSMKDGRMDGEVTETIVSTKRIKDEQPEHFCSKSREYYVNGVPQRDSVRSSDC